MSFEDYKQKHTDITELYSHPEKWIGQVTTVCGWIRFFRISGGKGKSMAFVRLSDGTCLQTLQILYDTKSLPEENKTYFDDILKRGKTGMSIKTIGLIVKSPKAEQPIEMQAHSYEICGDVLDPDTYPISKNEHSLEFLRTVPHLRVRTDTIASVMRIKSAVRFAMAEYFDHHGFIEVQIPLITDNECESGANAFIVTTVLGDGHISIGDIPVKDDDKTSIDFTKDFFHKLTYLTVSGQLHLEAMALSLSKVWTMTTAFRAEPSFSPLHEGEFWMVELEFAFGTLENNMTVNEGCIKYCISKVIEKCFLELEFLQNKFKQGLIDRLKRYATLPFVRTTHEECIRLMLLDIESGKVKIDPDKKAGDDIHIFKEVPTYDGDLSKDHEKYITGILFGDMPVFCCYYPSKIKAFYMPKINKGDDIEKCENFDLLFPQIGEVVGGSMRETDYEELKSRMVEMGIKPESLEFYLDFRKYGTAPHGGSGIGFDRLMLMITGMENVKDMTPFPRACSHCYF